MSRLECVRRPMVMFDVQNKDHRNAAKQFYRTGSWNGCPWTFAIPDDASNVPAYISRELLLYFFEQEERGKNNRKS